MTVTAARAAAEQLRVALLDNGVRAVSLELQPGVGPKADPWGVAPFVRGLGHHIVSRPPGTPGLALVKAGRSGANALQGPLCNGYGGFDLIARIITMGWANHPGEGGPWTVPGWGAVPKDNGRPYIFGWEFEGGIVPWTDEMHQFMARCGAGTLDWLGTLNHREPAPLQCWGEHGHPWAEGRKIDRLGYTAASGRARIAAARGTHPTAPPDQEDDMTRIIRFADGRCWVVNYGSHTMWHIPDAVQYDHLTSAPGSGGVGIPVLPGNKAPELYGSYLNVSRLADLNVPQLVAAAKKLSA